MNYSEYLPQILEQYPIVVVQHEHLRTSENVVVRLCAADGQFFALRIRKLIGAYREQILSELVFLRDLRTGTGADIPAPVATRAGELFCTVNVGNDVYMCILFTWVAGVHVGGQDVTQAQMGLMAQSVAQLHNFSRAYRPPVGFVRPVYDASWYLGSASWTSSADFVKRMNPDDAAFLYRLNDAVSAFLRTYPKNEATFGLIHYDLHVGNFLFGDGVANMIDFDECGFGYYLFDLAHILFEFVEHPNYEDFREVATAQYTASRGTERFPGRDLDMFLALQGVAYANWLYRIFWRDGNVDAMAYWVPKIVQRVKAFIA